LITRVGKLELRVPQDRTGRFKASRRVSADGKRCAQASAMLRHVADQLRQKWPKLAAFIDDGETDVLSYLDFPEQHRSKLHSTNPLERLNKEVKRRAHVVGIFRTVLKHSSCPRR
jgi:putative transposase